MTNKTQNLTSLIISVIAILTAFASGFFAVAEIRTENAVQNARINAMTESIADIKNSFLRSNEKLEQIYIMVASRHYTIK